MIKFLKKIFKVHSPSKEWPKIDVSKKPKFKIIAVDFDGTLSTNEWPGIGKPNIGLIVYLIWMRWLGVKVILWTCRSGEYLDQAVEFCKEHGLEFDAINENLPEIIEHMGGDTRKIYADIYIDDKSNTHFKLPYKE